LTVFGLDNTADALSVDLGYVAPRSRLGAIVFVGGTKSPEDGPKDSLSIRCASGTDVFSVEAGTIRANGLAIGFSGVEEVILDGAAGNDAYIVSALVATTTIEDSDGTEDLDFSAAASGVTIDLGMSSGLAQKIFVSSSATLALKGTFENVVGSSSADWIRGNSAANRLRGRGGSDELFGGGGDDTLHGGGGDDTLRGGGGNDTLYGGLGNNVLLGGAGDDFLDVSVAAAVGSDTRNLLIGGVGSDTLQGGSGQEILIGGTTKYDAKAAAFAAIMKEWTATSSFAQRALNLETGITAATLGLIRLVRKTAVRSGTVWDDGAPDSLFGGPGKDWFLDSPNDVTRDRGPRDR
jgi:Ca2+-binding RTX toxin-like protein